ncbi:hypothetical protein [Streptomyces sp. NPDC056982]|uniref:hypothetical protein n=1 Tax=Streptomyces sp. NPDC056982 TaxID=3345986 RepID=UPI0036356B71
MAWPTEPTAHRSVARCPRAVDTRALASDDVRRVIGLCGQDAHVFGSSLRENLRLARPDAEECDLRGAVDRARLLDRVDSLPAGLDTMVGEHHGPAPPEDSGSRRRARCSLSPPS